jgi:hypothetical protein
MTRTQVTVFNSRPDQSAPVFVRDDRLTHK